MNSQIKLPDYLETLKEFEEHGKKDWGQQSGPLSEDQIKMLIGGAILVIVALLIILVLVSSFLLKLQ
jgi:hypothetical protein